MIPVGGLMNSNEGDFAPGVLAARYLGDLTDRLLTLQTRVIGSIGVAAEAIADSLCGGGVLHAWGSGHSFMLAKELFYRSGGLAAVNPLYDLNLTGVTNGSLTIAEYDGLPGYSPRVFKLHNVNSGECLIVFSPTGATVAAVDICLAAKDLGLRTIAVTSVDYALNTVPRHESGKRLHELADIVIDNPIAVGDCTVEVDQDLVVGATGVVTGTAICQLIVVEVVAACLRRGVRPPIIQANLLPGSSGANAQALAPYLSRVRHL